MWIRNQRKNALVNINFLRVINDGNYCLICGATTDGYDCELGVYSTEEKALDVLDEIKDAIEDTFYYNTSNSTDGCPIATDSDSSQGSYIYASKEAAINAWNGRTDDDLTNYISKIMNIFYGSFINHNKELILIPKTNLYFYLGDVNTVDEVKCKLLEWCSRSCFKSMPYRYTKKNREYQDDVLRKVNECLDMEFTREQMELIYTKLGNCINHELTMKFVSSDYDMKLLEEENAKHKY